MKQYQKKAYLKSILVVSVTMVVALMGEVTYGQEEPPMYDCVYPWYPSKQRTYIVTPSITQAQLDQDRRFRHISSTSRWLCGSRAEFYITPGRLQGVRADWNEILRDLGWPGYWSYPPEYTISMYLIEESTNTRRRFGVYDMMTGQYNGVPKFQTGRAGWYTVEIVSDGVVRNSGLTHKNFTNTAEYLIQAGNTFGNSVNYAPRYVPIPDPCRYEFRMSLQPNRINLGSQTTRNFSDDVRRTANFKVEAIRSHYTGCNAPNTHPRVTLSPQGGRNVDGIMYLDNGSEIEVMDMTGGQRVQFDVPIQMGRVLESYRSGKVERSYKLTWRRTPGAEVKVDEFRKVIKIQVEFP